MDLRRPQPRMPRLLASLNSLNIGVADLVRDNLPWGWLPQSRQKKSNRCHQCDG